MWANIASGWIYLPMIYADIIFWFPFAQVEEFSMKHQFEPI